MKRVRLIHWKPEEAAAHVEQLVQAGFRCDISVLNPLELKKIRGQPPDAVIIDLTRLPMQGRDVAASLRAAKPTRSVPIVFAGGDPAKVDRIRELLPDATYTAWGEIEGALQRALVPLAAEPVAVESALAGYAGTPLAKKLGIREEISVLLLGAPDDFPILEVPPNVTIRTSGTRGDLVLWFVRSEQELTGKLPRMVRLAAKAGLWILWAKKGSALEAGLTQEKVRKPALAMGLVDYKVAALDKTWSGLKFTLRK